MNKTESFFKFNTMKPLLIISTLILAILLPINAYAAEPTNIVLEKQQVVNNDYFAAGETVTLSGTVNGDAYVAGGNVIIEGVVNGDLLAAGGTVTIRGKVTQDARVAGGQINVTGEVGRNITTVGGSVEIADSAKINGSVTVGSGNINIFAPINKGVTAGAGQLTIGNIIEGDVQAGVGQITFTPRGKVNGNLTYWSDAKAQLTQNQVEGKITHNIPPKPSKESRDTARMIASGFNPAFNILSFFAALLVGLLLVRFMPDYVQRTANVVLNKPFQSLGVGFLAIILSPIVFVLLFITIIGIPLDLMLLAGFMILVYLAKIYVGVAIGQKVLKQVNKKAALGWSLVLGLLIYYILTMIPIVGFFFWMSAGFIGLGAIFLERRKENRNSKKRG